MDKKIVDLTAEFLNYAEEKLEKHFSSKILYGLSIHIASTIERISSGKQIENHQLKYIKSMNQREFEISDILRLKIQEVYKMGIPEDETGFIAMFLCLDNLEKSAEGKVAVLVAMHG